MRSIVLAVPSPRSRRRSPAADSGWLRRILERLRGEAAEPPKERREPVDKPFPFFGE
ncbi:MAG: hypothetical protein OEL76_08965 [Siculibacillus sp.]|nr:hypothetical protein [Siculibacillus sp.]